MPVRLVAEADLPEVVALYWTYIRHRKGTIPQTLRTLFHELFFVNPFSDNEFPSLVYEALTAKLRGSWAGMSGACATVDKRFASFSAETLSSILSSVPGLLLPDW